MLKLGNTILTYRKQLKLTQEELATHCHVSSVAVSKWENNQSYPDITLLPTLARLFNITVDELLSFEATLPVSDVSKIEADCLAQFKAANFEEAFDYCQRILIQYPTNHYLKFRMGYVFQQAMFFVKTEQDVKKLTDKMIQLFNYSSTSDDEKIKQASISSLATCYMMQQNYDEALVTIDRLTPLVVNPSEFKANIHTLKEEYEQATHLSEQTLYESLSASIRNLESLANLAAKTKQNDQVIFYLNKHEALIKLVEFNINLPHHYLFAALTYATCELKQETCAALRALLLTLTHSNTSASPLFNTLTFTQSNLNLSDLNKMLLQTLTLSPAFNFVKEDKSYRELLNYLTTQTSV